MLRKRRLEQVPEHWGSGMCERSMLSSRVVTHTPAHKETNCRWELRGEGKVKFRSHCILSTKIAVVWISDYLLLLSSSVQPLHRLSVNFPIIFFCLMFLGCQPQQLQGNCTLWASPGVPFIFLCHPGWHRMSASFLHSFHAFHYFPLCSSEKGNSACFAFCDAVSSVVGNDVFHQSIQLFIFYFTEQQQSFIKEWNIWERIQVKCVREEHRCAQWKNAVWKDIGLRDKCWNWLSERGFYSAVILEWKSHVNGNS